MMIANHAPYGECLCVDKNNHDEVERGKNQRESWLISKCFVEKVNFMGEVR